MSAELTLTVDEARMISLIAQHLEGVPARRRKRPTKVDVLEVFRALGCIQLDTISVVARSHETVLWSRLGPYDPALIRELHYPDRALIEYWVHAAAIAPVEMLPFLRRQMQRRRHDERSNAGSWQATNRDLVLEVLGAVAQNGAMQSRDFERPAGPRADPWTWYGGKPAKQALDALWSAGELNIQQRIGFQRVYELTDDAFPGWRDAELPTEAEERRYFVSNALRAMGVATSRWTADYFRGSSTHVSAVNALLELKSLAEEGLAIPARLDHLKEPLWIDPAMWEILEAYRAGELRPARTTLLSPFDNLIWNRERALALFNFDYRIECYTPAEKRRYGYYSLPILHKGKLVGRLDPVYKRREKRLILNAVHLEPGVRPSSTLARAVRNALQSYLTHLGGGEIEASGGGNIEFMAMLHDDIRPENRRFAPVQSLEPPDSPIFDAEKIG